MPIAFARAAVNRRDPDGSRPALPLRARRARRAAGVLALALLASLVLLPCAPAQAQTTIDLVSNTGQSHHSSYSYPVGQTFTTGTHGSSYIVTQVQVVFNSTGSTTVRIRKNDGGGRPTGTLVATLSGGGTGTGTRTFTAPANTMLEANTTYWVTINEGTASPPQVGMTSSDSETGQPGWLISNSSDYQFQGNWTRDTTASARIAVRGYLNSVSLRGGRITDTGARITIGGHTAAWWYKKTSPSPAGTCTSVGTGTTRVDLTGLTANTSYTYKAYSNSTCTAANELASATFTTRPAPPSWVDANATAVTYGGTTLQGTGALTTAFTSGNLLRGQHVALLPSNRLVCASGTTRESGWYRSTALTTRLGTEQHGLGAGISRFDYTPTGAGEYRMLAYCTTGSGMSKVYSPARNLMGTNGKLTLTGKSLSAGMITATGARITIGGHTTAWWYKGNQSGATCTSVSAGTTYADLTGLTSGTSYTYKAYSNSTCATELASVTFTASAASPTLSADRITQTGARLTIANGPSTWYYKSTAIDASCSSAQSTTTATLTGLSADTDYTYKAYSNSGCTTEVTNNARDADFSTLALTSSMVTATGARITIANHTAAWWYRKTVPTPAGTCTSVNAGTTHVDLTGLTASTSYTYKAYSASTCAAANELASETFSTTGLTTLSADRITQTGARLTITNGPATWYYKANKTPHNTCSSAQSGTAVTLSGLTANTSYTYKAYSDSGCATEVTNAARDADFTTKASTAGTVSNINESTHSATYSIPASRCYASAFTTGGTSTARYTLNSVIVSIKVEAAGRGQINVSIHNPGTGSATNNPGTQVGSNLTGTIASNGGDTTYTASGITLNGSGTYFLRLCGSTAGRDINMTASDAQTGGTGWSIANAGRLSTNSGTSWSTLVNSVVPKFTLNATAAAAKTLTAGNVTTTGARLTIGGHTAAWWYKQTAPSAGTCTSVSAGTTRADLTGLTAGTSYTYKAYSNSTCATELASETFSTSAPAAPTLTNSRLQTVNYVTTQTEPSDITLLWRSSFSFTSGTLMTGSIAPGTVNCTSGTAELGWYRSTALTTRLGTYTHIGGGIYYLRHTPTAAGEYRALAYCKSGTSYSTPVSLMRGGAVTLTAPLTSSRVTQTGARITIGGHTAAWWYKQTAPSAGTCTQVNAGTSHADLTGLTANTSHTYKAYSKTGCNTADEIASETFTTTGLPTLTSGSVTQTEARITIANHTTAWWYRKTSPTPAGTCTSVSAGTTHVDLTGLTASTSYTYKAYSNSTCATELASRTFSTLASDPRIPANVRAVAGSNAHMVYVILHWDRVPGATYYHFRHREKGGEWIEYWNSPWLAAWNGRDNLHCTWPCHGAWNLDPSTEYEFQVRAESWELGEKAGTPKWELWQSGPSATVSATTGVKGASADPDSGPPAAVSLSVSPGTVDEGLPVEVTATLSKARSSRVVVPLAVTDVTSEAGDYRPPPSIVIAAGSTTGSGPMHTRQGWLFLPALLLRPALMLLGLILGYFVFLAGIGLFNQVWLPQMRDAGVSGGLGPVGFLAMLALYVIVAYGLMNASFKLIDLLPSAVLDWIGGRAGAGEDGGERAGGTAVAGFSRLSAVRVGARTRRGGTGS